MVKNQKRRRYFPISGKLSHCPTTFSVPSVPNGLGQFKSLISLTFMLRCPTVPTFFCPLVHALSPNGRGQGKPMITRRLHGHNGLVHRILKKVFGNVSSQASHCPTTFFSTCRVRHCLIVKYQNRRIYRDIRLKLAHCCIFGISTLWI